MYEYFKDVVYSYRGLIFNYRKIKWNIKLEFIQYLH